MSLLRSGTLQPIRRIAALAHEQGALVHTDAAQSVGKLPVDVADLGVDLLSVAGHKMYAPKGIGVLFTRRGVLLESLIHGAGHEGGRRAGTENVASIVALGAASEVARRGLPQSAARLRQLRDRLWEALKSGVGNRLVLNGHPILRLPNTLNVSIVGDNGAEILAEVPEIAASTGSACHEGQAQMSPVLAAMGVSEAVGLGVICLSVGRFTSESEVDRAASLLAARIADRHRAIGARPR